VAVLLVFGLGLFWAFSSSPTDAEDPGLGPQPPVPMGAPKGQTPTEAAPSNPATAPGTPAPAATGTNAVAGAEGQNPADPEAAKTEPAGGVAAADPANSPGGVAGSGNTAVAANAGEAQPSGVANNAGTAAAAGTSATATPATPETPKSEVGVVFKTNYASIRVDGKKIEPNKVLTYPPGKITVEWSCPPKRRREGSDIKRLKAGRKEPYVYEIRCRKSSR
jgi:hypothetical protein